MSEQRTPAPDSDALPIVHLLVGLAIIPANLFVFKSVVDTIHRSYGALLTGYMVLAVVQLLAGLSAGVSGTRRWKVSRKGSDLTLAVAGWTVAVAALIGLVLGTLVPGLEHARFYL